jgi:hypothetical protein
MLNFCPSVFFSGERGLRPDNERVLCPVPVRLAGSVVVVHPHFARFLARFFR